MLELGLAPHLKGFFEQKRNQVLEIGMLQGQGQFQPQLLERGAAAKLAVGVQPTSRPCPAVLVKSSCTTRSLKSRSPPPSMSSQPQVLAP